MGLENRSPTQGELDEMKAMLEQALREGSFGMSAGLSASPGCWASTEELIELAKVVKKHDGVYMVHQRGEIMGEIERGALPRIEESIEIAEKSGVRTCMSHVLLDPETRRLVDDARAKGVDITCDMFPYPGSIASNLVYMLPHWLARHREDGLEFIVDKLKDPAVRKKLIKKDIPDWFRTAASIPGRYEAPLGAAKMRWDHMQLQKVWTAKNRKYIGSTFDQIAKDKGTDPWNALMDIIVEEDGYARWLSLYHSGFEDMYWPAFAETLKAPYGCIESDAPIESPRGVTATSADPRSYGIFPLVLGEYVRKRNVVTWEAAIKKMTSDSARAMGIADRGLLREGFWADIVVFDPRTIAHRANFKNCLEVSLGINHDLYPVGIEYVTVNGVIAAEKGKLTGSMSGQVLRHRVPSA
jgi:N-acyl-D-aspartate/D-glutamate deacylase